MENSDQQLQLMEARSVEYQFKLILFFFDIIKFDLVGGAHEDATSQAFYAGQAFVYTFQTSTSSWNLQKSLSATNPVTFASFAKSLV